MTASECTISREELAEALKRNVWALLTLGLTPEEVYDMVLNHAVKYKESIGE